MMDPVPEPETAPGSAGADDPVASGDELAEVRAQLDAARGELQLAETEGRLASEREALLRGELLHRVRNILAIVRSIFSRTMAAGGSLDDVASHFRGRLDALSRNQTVRGLEPGGEADLESIVREELHSFHFGEEERISIAGPEVSIGHDMAQLIGLAIHELVTNSLKYGALSGADARTKLRIAWAVVDDRLNLEWEEKGVAMVASAPHHSGFGREYIEQALPYQIGATTLFELRPGGIFCSLALPLAAEVPVGRVLTG